MLYTFRRSAWVVRHTVSRLLGRRLPVALGAGLPAALAVAALAASASTAIATPGRIHNSQTGTYDTNEGPININRDNRAVGTASFSVGVPPGLAASAAGVGFASPSRNVGCLMYNTQVRCDIRNRDWKAPKKPKWCPVDYGQGVIVTKRGRASYECAGDTVLNQQKRLNYGRSIRRGDFKCTSGRSGMRCVNHRTHHGFKLSREKVVLF